MDTKATTATETTETTTPNETPLADLAYERQQALLMAYEHLPQPERYSDVGDAKLTEVYYHPVLRHTDELGWLRYHEGVWDSEQGKKEARRAVSESLHLHAQRHVDALGTKAGGELYTHLHNAFNRIAAITEELACLRTMSARTSQFDTHPDWLNCANGVVDLGNGTLQPHSPQHYLTRQTPYRFDDARYARIQRRLAAAAEAHENKEDRQAVWFEECPQWMRFLHSVFLHDPDLIDWLQRLFGYFLTGRTSEQVMVILYGGGRNGKSKLLSVLHQLLGGGKPDGSARAGSFAASVLPEVFVRNTKAVSNGSGATPELAKLDGMRLAWSEEPEGNDRGWQLAAATVKRLTGGTPITARKLYHEPYEFTPRFKPVLAVNHRPRITEDTDGMWRRIRAIPFKARFEGASRVPDIDQVLLEAEAEGILLWLVAGAARWYAEGLGEVPQAVQAETEDYRERDRTYYGFFAYQLIHSANRQDVVPLDTAYKAFEDWRLRHADEIREALRIDTPTNHWDDLRPLPAMSARKFGELVVEQGFLKERRKTGRVLVGAVLHSALEADEARRAMESGANDPGNQGNQGNQADTESGEAPASAEGSAGSDGCRWCRNDGSFAKVSPERSQDHFSKWGGDTAPTTPVTAPETHTPPTEDRDDLEDVEDVEAPQEQASVPLEEPKTVPVVEPSLAEREEPGEQVCSHCGAGTGFLRYDGGRDRLVRCARCRTRIGPATPDPLGCHHSAAMPLSERPTHRPDVWPYETDSDERTPGVTVDERVIACPDCHPEGQSWGERMFLCALPTAHRASWDSLGCPLCDAAWQERHPGEIAREDAYAATWDRQEAERHAREAENRAREEQWRREWEERRNPLNPLRTQAN